MAAEEPTVTKRPLMSLPNRITFIRMGLVPVFVIVVMQVHENPTYRTLALAIFSAMAASDVLDGVLARRFREESELGTFLDPMADKALMVVAFIMLASRYYFDPPLLPNWLAVLVISRDVFITFGFAVLYIMTGEIYIEPTRLGKATTGFQMSTIIVALLPDGVGVGEDILQGLVWVTGGLTVVSGIDYFYQGLRKFNEAMNRKGGSK